MPLTDEQLSALEADAEMLQRVKLHGTSRRVQDAIDAYKALRAENERLKAAIELPERPIDQGGGWTSLLTFLEGKKLSGLPEEQGFAAFHLKRLRDALGVEHG
jgi:hypothetical protein